MTDSQFDTLAGLLTEIRDRLTYLCGPPDEPEAVASCEHPEARRTDFSTPRETDWICGDCGHHEQRTTGNHAPALPPSASAKE